MKGFASGLSPVWLAGCLVVGGCKREEPAPTPIEAPASVREEAPPAPPPEAPAPESEPEEGPVAEAGAPRAATPPAPSAPAGAVAPEDLKNREWTAGNVALRRPSLRPVTLKAVRAARNEGFDRVVFEFDGPQVPGYQLEYIDSPVIKCGSGDPTAIAGQGWLQVRLTPAQAHTEQGQPTVTAREQKPGLPVILELELTCDFEGEVTWVLGNQKPNKYRVMELREPTRLVVDVQH